MLIMGFGKIGKTEFANKYKDKVKELTFDNYKNVQDQNTVILFIQDIKKYLNEYEIVIIPFLNQLKVCLDALKIKYVMAYPSIDCQEDYLEYWDDFKYFYEADTEKLELSRGQNLEQALSKLYSWIDLEEPKQLVVPENKNKLTLEQLIDDDIEITEADVRDLKATQNKLKVGMLLQAKNSLNRILKLSNVLDKLYDELLNRIDNNLENTDTASLMYTTDYISKALHDTNQFIVNLISNEKIQNFFIIDNSNIVNINDNNSVQDLDKRERIRKAVSIVLNNLDAFEQGNYQNLKDPNAIIIDNKENNNGTTVS